MSATPTDTDLAVVDNLDPIEGFDSHSFMEDFRASAAERGIDLPTASKDLLPVNTDDWVRESLASGPSLSEELARVKGESPTNSQLIESIGGMKALEGIARLAKGETSIAEFVAQVADPEAQQEFIWSILEQNDNLILEDQDVQNRIAQAFGAKSIQQINDALALWESYYGDQTFRDPVEVANENRRSQEFETNFFRNAEVIEAMKPYFESLGGDLIDDAGHAAQSRFLAANVQEFTRLQDRYARGEDIELPGIRLQNKFMATLLGCLNRVSGKAPKAVTTKVAKQATPTQVDDDSTPGLDADASTYSAWFSRQRAKAAV